MKATFHKSCSCSSCVRGRATEGGKVAHRMNEKKLRQRSRLALAEVKKGADDAVVAPISSPYTD